MRDSFSNHKFVPLIMLLTWEVAENKAPRCGINLCKNDILITLSIKYLMVYFYTENKSMSMLDIIS